MEEDSMKYEVRHTARVESISGEGPEQEVRFELLAAIYRLSAGLPEYKQVLTTLQTALHNQTPVTITVAGDRIVSAEPAE